MANQAARTVEEEIRLEHTDNRIRGYLAAVRPTSGGPPVDSWWLGRSVIERMAIHSKDYDEPDLELTLEECADALRFVECSEPINPRAFYSPMANPSPHVGMMFVLRAIADRLRAHPDRKRSA